MRFRSDPEILGALGAGTVRCWRGAGVRLGSPRTPRGYRAGARTHRNPSGPPGHFRTRGGDHCTLGKYKVCSKVYLHGVTYFWHGLYTVAWRLSAARERGAGGHLAPTATSAAPLGQSRQPPPGRAVPRPANGPCLPTQLCAPQVTFHSITTAAGPR